MATFEATTPQLQLLKSYIEAAQTINTDNLEPFYSKNFKIQTLPKTDERPDMSKDEYLQKLRGMAPRVAKADFTTHDLVDAPGKLVTHATARCTTHDGGTHDYESLTIFTFVEEEGQLKIFEIKEFTNPTDRDKFESGLAQVQPLKA